MPPGARLFSDGPRERGINEARLRGGLASRGASRRDGAAAGCCIRERSPLAGRGLRLIQKHSGSFYLIIGVLVRSRN